MKRTTALTALLSLACTPGVVAAQPESTPGPSLSRKRVTDIIAARQKIVSPRGVEELFSIPVNGATEWLSIRGQDARNPILLFLHGGPGSPTMPEAWTFQTPWEDFFTVVQWDQRGAGKTYASNDPKALASTMTAAQMIDDTEHVVRYLLKRFHKQKIFVLGHSWGSYLGLNLAHLHPEWLHAYIGTGQIIDMLGSEAQGFRFAMDQAKAHGNAQAVRELQAIAPYPGPAGLTLERITVQRTWLTYYGGLTYGRSDFQYDADAWHLSPAYADRDLALIDEGGLYSLHHLLAVLARANFENVTEFKCPIFMFTGKHDYTTSHTIIEQWYRRVRAPKKALVWFENSAHMVMLEQPGRYLDHLIHLVRPIAVDAGDAAAGERVE